MKKGGKYIRICGMESEPRANEQRISEYRSGLIASIGCMVLWGILPVYWKALVPISSWVIIIYRILLVHVFAILLAKTKFSWQEIFGPIRSDRKLALKYLAAGAVITTNWSTYIWAVNAGHVIDSSVGYYIEPLMVCLFGMLCFREKLTRYKAIAMGLALLAVIILLVHFHTFPGIALGLALSFAVYSAIKKTVTQPPLISLVYETIFFAPPALVAIIWLELHGKGALGVGQPYQYGLLLLCGLLTVIPLSLFASAAQKVPLFTLGLTEYISPTMSLILGVFFFREAFDRIQFLAVIVIWIGLVFFSVGELREQRNTSAT